TREGRSRSRCCVVAVSSNTASTSSNRTTCVNSPRCPGAKAPPATVTVRVMLTVADWDGNETSALRKIFGGSPWCSRGLVLYAAATRRCALLDRRPRSLTSRPCLKHGGSSPKSAVAVASRPPRQRRSRSRTRGRTGAIASNRPHVRQQQPALRTVLGDVTDLEPIIQQPVSGRVPQGRQSHHAEDSRRSTRHRRA